MIVISPTDLQNEQKKYLELAETEKVVVKRGDKFIHLVVSDRAFLDDAAEQGVIGDELKKRVFKHIDTLFEK
ncbi:MULTISPECIES: hypothetical protein [Myroides]|uniref:hypothetical protein n=1 Tax=Myroides TaxID=76831 RepID=UPI0008F46270|nr:MULTISPECIES: hypothetical protein [Myroides]APA91780.1 hypothetical protein BK054_06020 [Myroides sp. ZB35]MDM1508518.1 hypothetical protein [Myroides odoratimimus]MDM1525035.1 hypothetical protein [Myroides odoratimimus]MDM1678610.1 hypothetical protein [Myroides odoratimimus]MEC4033968.1 hypothetical protein [Myroides odoratimimus]